VAMEEPEIGLSAFLKWVMSPGIPAEYPIDPDRIY